jgi:hypothetical protein
VDKCIDDCPNINLRVAGLGIVSSQLGSLARLCIYINEPCVSSTNEAWSWPCLSQAKYVSLPSTRTYRAERTSTTPVRFCSSPTCHEDHEIPSLNLQKSVVVLAIRRKQTLIKAYYSLLEAGSLKQKSKKKGVVWTKKYKKRDLRMDSEFNSVCPMQCLWIIERMTSSALVSYIRLLMISISMSGSR